MELPAVIPRTLHHISSVVVLSLFVTVGRSGAGDSVPADRAFFENHIRPVLVEHCYQCHSADSDQLGGNLRLDERDALRSGGESSPPIIAGDPANSLIIQALQYDGVEMPPSDPLAETVIANFEKWIARGAVDPRVHVADAPAYSDSDVADAKLWSLEPVRSPTIPEVADSDWSDGAIDRFVRAKMGSAHVNPALRADSETLVRRLYIDLIGLPPTFAAAQAFVTAAEMDRDRAVEHLVDDLLSRPSFGERWGRHWLDVARYGESNGNDGLSRNPTFPHAWRYRDYVIDSFNADVPYDQFLLEQIAGDLLPTDSPEQSDRHKIATGFLAMTAKPAKAMNTNFEMDVVADQIDVIGRGVMGLSLGCARCHDHKFDPVPTRDYYALAGIFTSTETMWGLAGNEKLTAPATDLHVLKTAPNSLPPEGFVESVILLESATGKPKTIPKPKWPVGSPLAMGVREAKQIVNCKVNINGDAKKLGKPVPRGFLSAVSLRISDAQKPADKQSGRLELAQWLTHPEHPLTSRVMVNRIWMHLFGSGIVRTPDDFGQYGDRPTHPLLLDYLASRFVKSGWSVKRLIREIVLSRTYQLSANPGPSQMEEDAENLLLTRHRRRRMDSETIRDSMLSASGELDLAPASGSIIRYRDILVNLAGNLHQPSRHRSVYLCYLRSSPPPELAPFNLPEFTQVVGQRETTVISSQSLHLMNSPFVVRQSEMLAVRALKSSTATVQRIRDLYRRVLAREPSPSEIQDASNFVTHHSANASETTKAWANLCQALFMTNEFRYVD